MKSGDLLKLALVAGGGYLLYTYLVQSGMWAQWFGGTTTASAALPASSTASTSIAATAAPPAISYNPQMNVQTVGGNTGQVTIGDAWSVSITGAPPNTPVTITATQSGGATQNMQLGTTDANGNFTSQGTVPNMPGQWMEIWYVGGNHVGNWDFTISSPMIQSGGSQPGMQGVGAIVPTPNTGPIRNPLPSMSFGGGYGKGWVN